jgi:Mrp family chromosome partitioning ATPase
LDVHQGLSAALSSDEIDPEPQTIRDLPNLHVLCGGPAPPFPAELLGSKRMKSLLAQWRSEYDFIVLDGPPALPVTDAIVLEQMCDAVLLIARHGKTVKKAIHRSYRTLASQLPPHAVLGTILNAVPDRSADFYEYYGYRSHYSAENGSPNEARA